MGSYFIQWLYSVPVIVYFDALIFSRFDQCEPIQAGFYIFLTYFHYSLSTFFLLAAQGVPGTSSLSPALALENQPFLQEALVPFSGK